VSDGVLTHLVDVDIFVDQPPPTIGTSPALSGEQARSLVFARDTDVGTAYGGFVGPKCCLVRGQVEEPPTIGDCSTKPL
jgi:hypothetical protein